MNSCPLCSMSLVRESQADGDAAELQCENCGAFHLSNSLEAELTKGQYSLFERARISFGLRRMSRHPNLTTHLVESVLRSAELPNASNLLDNLLLHMANESPAPGETMALQAFALPARLGAQNPTGVRWAVEQALSAQLITGIASRGIGGPHKFSVPNATLTLKGWARVEELLRSANGSRKGFMAMQFGDAQLDAIFRDHFRPAVFQAGFNLTRLDDEPRAGLIDDRLRVEIRTSRFMVADLTHANAGAYWEAGFAEGLGRPVIYTCRKDVFDNPATKPHFDTNHYLTVVWDPVNPAAAAEQLKTVIRVTLPTEAALTDVNLTP